MQITKNVRYVLINIGLLISACFLFALPHPTDLFLPGLPFLSYFAFIPVFLLVQRSSWKSVWLYGLLYGLGGYFIYVFWLATFDPVAMPVIAGMYGIYLLLTFLVLKLASELFPKYSSYAQWVVWCAYEYIKTTGFTGFNYGVTAYSHWKWTLLIQCVDVIGVFGLSAVISFTSAWITAVINDKASGIGAKIRNHWIAGAAWAVVFCAIIVYGFVSPVDYSQNDTMTVALMETNADPWRGGESAYKVELNKLMKLSDQALAENPDVQLVVWPETAFVPRITWHYQHRENRNLFNYVDTLLKYLDSKEVPFLIGNDDAVMGYTSDGVYGSVDYNSALLFRPGVNVIPPKPETYHKMHLVPFTESFPFKKSLPVVYEMLKENDTHFWEIGDEAVVFEVDGVKFGSPICFEDTFGYITRRYVNNGAQFVANMTNDAWAHSEACQTQHLAMALFRSVENRIPTVRSTASGPTCIIDPNGKITACAEQFAETYLVGTIPVMDVESHKTIYTRYGDYAGIFFVVAASLLIVAGIVIKLVGKKNGKNALSE